MLATLKQVFFMIQEGALLWTPSKEFAENTYVAQFMVWLQRDLGKSFASYAELHAWSVTDLEGFWGAVWRYFDICSDTPYKRVLDRAVMPGAKWFEGARVNYAEHVLRAAHDASPDRTAIVSRSEIRPMQEMSWTEMSAKVRRLATSLRELGVQPGDRVVAYLPNTPEAIVAMLATVAIGAIWSSAAPEFGTAAVIDRFAQIQPKLFFAADGYSFNGRHFDRSENVREIAQALSSLEHLVWLPYLDTQSSAPAVSAAVHGFVSLWDGPAISEQDFAFERVEQDHPLWILYSSGTTGLPKAIVHSHVGMLVTHLMGGAFHHNLGPASRMFFYTTTGWMMFNALASSLLRGASIVTYDGSPTYPRPDVLWELTADCKATVFGASPTFVQGMQKQGIRPIDLFDLSHIELILCTGSPAQPETFAWFYEAVKNDFWLSSSSGGTDICGAIVAGIPLLPVSAGEIQCPALGIDARAFREDGSTVIGEIGELVIAAPAPSMPLYFWNDTDGKRYHESYFAEYPGIWRHGDFILFKEGMSSIIYGRSDSTLNRHGVRIGTSEIYRCVEQIPEVADSLVVCLEREPGLYYMPLFVKLSAGSKFTPELESRIRDDLRKICSPRHVPDEIHSVSAIPYTLSGKKMEIPVRKILEGKPFEKVASKDAMADPTALEYFRAFAHTSRR